MASWGLAEAKAHFSEVVMKAMTEGPQEVSKGGKDAVVIVSKAEWDKKTKKKYANAAEFARLNSELPARYGCAFANDQGSSGRWGSGVAWHRGP